MTVLRLEISLIDTGKSREDELAEIQRLATFAVGLMLDVNAGRQYHTLTDGDGNNIGSIFYQTSDFREPTNETGKL